MLECFTLYDKESKIFHPPQFSRSVVPVVRSLVEAAQDKATMLNKYPAQFALYRIGTFNDETGMLEGAEPVLILTLNDVLERQNPEAANGNKS